VVNDAPGPADHDCLPPQVEPASPDRWRCDGCGAQWELTVARQWRRLSDWEWDGG